MKREGTRVLQIVLTAFPCLPVMRLADALVYSYLSNYWKLVLIRFNDRVAELKQDGEVANEWTASEPRRSENCSATDADASDAVTVTISEDSQQKLEESCEQLFKQLKEARRDVGRPEDLRVDYVNLLI